MQIIIIKLILKSWMKVWFSFSGTNLEPFKLVIPVETSFILFQNTYFPIYLTCIILFKHIYLISLTLEIDILFRYNQVCFLDFHFPCSFCLVASTIDQK